MSYPDVLLHIDGAWTQAAGGKTLSVMNPATGEENGKLAHAERADLDRALEAAEKGFAVWRKVSAYDRSKIMRKAADLLRERAGDIAVLMTMEQGKPVGEAKMEAMASADVIDWFAEEARRTYGRVIPARAEGVYQLSLREPVGPVAAFTPWNFPINQANRKIAIALAAGCSIIVKGPEETPASCMELVRCYVDAGVPAGVVQLVFGVPSEISEYLIPHPIIRKVSFTGSTAVGKQLAALAGLHMKRATMELGGHAPAIVFDDADIAAATKMLAAAKFRNAGQVCISPTRFLVQNSAYEQFVDSFTAAAKAVKVGNGMEQGIQMGPLANPRRITAMEGLIARRGAEGRRGADRGQADRQRGQFLRADGDDGREHRDAGDERGAVRAAGGDRAVRRHGRSGGGGEPAALWAGELCVHEVDQAGEPGGGEGRGGDDDDQPYRAGAAGSAVRRDQG